tara:strand:+ start:542 stop:754 length:213 start_codon:yes stop_codon:yes gene_type:complete
MKTKQTVSNLQCKIQKIKKELETIQDNCKHTTTIPKFNKKNSIRLFCAECDLEVGMPSAKQIKEFLNTDK